MEMECWEFPPRYDASYRPEASSRYWFPVRETMPSAERERALGLHAKGVEQLERGNIFAARKFFEHATAAGLAQCRAPGNQGPFAVNRHK